MRIAHSLCLWLVMSIAIVDMSFGKDVATKKSLSFGDHAGRVATSLLFLCNQHPWMTCWLAYVGYVAGRQDLELIPLIATFYCSAIMVRDFGHTMLHGYGMHVGSCASCEQQELDKKQKQENKDIPNDLQV